MKEEGEKFRVGSIYTFSSAGDIRTFIFFRFLIKNIKASCVAMQSLDPKVHTLFASAGFKAFLFYTRKSALRLNAAVASRYLVNSSAAFLFRFSLLLVTVFFFYLHFSAIQMYFFLQMIEMIIIGQSSSPPSECLYSLLLTMQLQRQAVPKKPKNVY